MMRSRSAPLLVLLAALIAAGCGGSDATAEQRIERCLEKQPDATKADCEQWEEDGELDDDGTHRGHEE